MSLRSGIKRIPVSLLFAVLALTGTLIRIAGNRQLFTTELVFISDISKEQKAGERPEHYTISGDPEETAVLFYSFLEQGRYDEAWEISMEPVWGPPAKIHRYQDEVSPGTGAFSGWKGKEEFVGRQEIEIGPGGSGLRLSNLQAESLPWSSREYPINPVVLETAGFSRENLELIRVTGHMLGACTIFGWRKDVVVAETEEGYKILLEGTKGEKQFFYQAWFSDITKIIDLRSGG